MLNNLDISICPVCHGNNIPTSNGNMACPCDTGYGPRHCLMNDRLQQIRVGQYLLLFTRKNLSIFEHRFIMSKPVLEIPNCSLTYQDLDNEDKIQILLKHYQILS